MLGRSKKPVAFGIPNEQQIRKEKFDASLKEKAKLKDERKNILPSLQKIETSSLDESMEKIKKFPKVEEQSPADKGFEAARHEDEYAAEMKKLSDFLNEQNKKLDQLIESDKKVHEEIFTEEHEFVESVETEQSGGGVMLDYIRFKDTDLFIVTDYNGIGIYENEQSFHDGDAPMEYFEKEEMEKVNIEDLNEYSKMPGSELEGLTKAERVNMVVAWYETHINGLESDTTTEKEAGQWLDKIMGEQQNYLDQSDEAIIWDLIKAKLKKAKTS